MFSVARAGSSIIRPLSRQLSGITSAKITPFSQIGKRLIVGQLQTRRMSDYYRPMGYSTIHDAVTRHLPGGIVAGVVAGLLGPNAVIPAVAVSGFVSYGLASARGPKADHCGGDVECGLKVAGISIGAALVTAASVNSLCGNAGDPTVQATDPAAIHPAPTGKGAVG